MPPTGVASAPVTGGRDGLAWVAVQPPVHPVRVDLFRPDQPGAGLTQHPHGLVTDICWGRCRVELVGLPLPKGHQFIESTAVPGGRTSGVVRVGTMQPQPQFGPPAGRNGHSVPPGGLGAHLVGVHRGVRPRRRDR